MRKRRGRGMSRGQRGGSRSTSTTKRNTRPSSQKNVNLHVFVKPENFDDQEGNAKRFKTVEHQNDSIAQSSSSSSSFSLMTSSTVPASNCVLCDSLLSKNSSYYEKDDLNLDKCFDAFCTFLNITLSPELSYDFKIDNFPFCGSCRQILSKLLEFYDILEETHFKVTAYVAKVKNIIRKLSINQSTEAPSNLHIQRINHIRESIKSQINDDLIEDEQSLPFESQSNLKLEQEENRLDFSNSSTRTIDGNVEVLNVQNHALDEESTHENENLVENGNRHREEEEEGVSSTFESYLVAQLKLIDFIEASTKSVDTANTENDTDEEYCSDSVQDDNNSSTEIHESNNHEDDNSVIEFDDSSNHTTDNSSSIKVSDIYRNNNNNNNNNNKGHVIQEENEKQVEEPATTTIIGGRSLRPRASLQKKSYIEIEIEDDKNFDEDFKGDDDGTEDDSSGTESDSNVVHQDKNSSNKKKVAGKSIDEIQTLYFCSLCGWIGLQALARIHFKSFHLNTTHRKCHICSCYLTAGNEEDHVSIHLNFIKLQNQHQKLVLYDPKIDSELNPSEFLTTLNNNNEPEETESPPRCILCPHNSDSPLETVHELSLNPMEFRVIPGQDHRVRYMCGHCGERFYGKESAAEHFKSCKLNEDNIVTCVLCKGNFSNLQEIKKHQEAEHLPTEKMKHFSERYYSYLEDDDGHFIRENTTAISRDELVSKLKCTVCENHISGSDVMAFSQHFHDAQHKLIDRPISCLECNFRTNSFSEAYIHFMLFHEKNMTYHCLKCLEVFPTLSLLAFHFSKSHVPVSPVLGEKKHVEEGVDYIQDI